MISSGDESDGPAIEPGFSYGIPPPMFHETSYSMEISSDEETLNETEGEHERSRLVHSDKDGTVLQEVVTTTGAEAIRISQEGAVQLRGRAGMAFSIFNLCNTVVGGGVLAVPFAFKSAGIGASSILLFVILILQIYTCAMLPPLRKHVGGTTYKDLMRASLKHTLGMTWLVDLTVFLNSFGLLIAYLIIIGDLLPPVVHFAFQGHNDTFLAKVLAERTLIIIFYSFFFIFPIFCLKKISYLQYTSFLAMIAMTYLTFVVVIRAPYKIDLDDLPSMVKFSPKFLLAFPLISLAFTCQYNVLPIQEELKKPTTGRMMMIIVIGLVFCSLMYITVGFFGYWTFHDDLHGNILLNYEDMDILVLIGRIAVTITITFSYPVVGFSGRQAALNCLSWMKKYKDVQFFVLTLVILISSMVIAILVPDITFVLDLVGAIFGTAVCYIAPPLFFIGVYPGKFYSPIKLPCYLILLLGVFSGILCTIITLWEKFGNLD